MAAAPCAYTPIDRRGRPRARPTWRQAGPRGYRASRCLAPASGFPRAAGRQIYSVEFIVLRTTYKRTKNPLAGEATGDGIHANPAEGGDTQMAKLESIRGGMQSQSWIRQGPCRSGRRKLRTSTPRPMLRNRRWRSGIGVLVGRPRYGPHRMDSPSRPGAMPRPRWTSTRSALIRTAPRRSAITADDIPVGGHGVVENDRGTRRYRA
jgi:hypothetical protein